VAAAGPRVVIAAVIRQAMRHAGRYGLQDAVHIARCARLDLGQMVRETVAEHEHLGWDEIGRILGLSPQHARTAYGSGQTKGRRQGMP
jgi:hypothetical protein